MDGILTFNDIEELKDLLLSVDADWYNKKKPAIDRNYELAKRWHSQNDVVPRLTRKIIQDVRENATKRIQSWE